MYTHSLKIKDFKILLGITISNKSFSSNLTNIAISDNNSTCYNIITCILIERYSILAFSVLIVKLYRRLKMYQLLNEILYSIEKSALLIFRLQLAAKLTNWNSWQLVRTRKREHIPNEKNSDEFASRTAAVQKFYKTNRNSWPAKKRKSIIYSIKKDPAINRTSSPSKRDICKRQWTIRESFRIDAFSSIFFFTSRYLHTRQLNIIQYK